MCICKSIIFCTKIIKIHCNHCSFFFCCINKFNKTRLEKQVLDFLEQQHRRRESGFERKMAFKKQVLES